MRKAGAEVVAVAAGPDGAGPGAAVAAEAATGTVSTTEDVAVAAGPQDAAGPGAAVAAGNVDGCFRAASSSWFRSWRSPAEAAERSAMASDAAAVVDGGG